MGSAESDADVSGGGSSGPEERIPPTADGSALPAGLLDGLQTIVADNLGPGATIGNYHVLQVLGEGGFGTVFLAEQQRPIRRRVALKVLKLGMDSRQIVARFDAERQALARMDHPNIAKVFDAGATLSGRPYFVMELVKGVPITHYCDTAKLHTRTRLELFVQVCLAIQHAHQKGIIHRDIKPSNILVVVEDDKAVPKVIDFGIAKAISGRLSEMTVVTEINQVIGTPEYMSPEQAEMNPLDVDTRTDIYALGVLLYELMTGATPFESKRLRSVAPIEMQRIIRDVEPSRPSVRLRTLGATLTKVATQRQTEPKVLEQALHGELDWIVMKAIEKDRTRRYDTAQGLALDVKRYLDGEPVAARPATINYRMRKFVRKHRWSVATAAVFVAALILGILGTSYGMATARAAQRRAQLSEKAATEGRDRIAALLDDVKQARSRAEEEAQRALDAKANAIEQASRAEAARKRSEIDARNAEIASVISRIAEADARLRTGDSAKAETLYADATHESARLGLSQWPPRLGLFEAYRAVGRPLVQIASESPLAGVGFLADNRTVVTGSPDGTFDVWDLPTGRHLRTFGDPGGSTRPNIAFSPDGKIAAAVRPENGPAIFRLELWEVETGRRLRIIPGIPAAISAIRFSDDGNLIYVGAKWTGRALVAFDVASGEKKRELKATLSGQGRVSLPLASPDGQYCILAGYGHAELWDIEKGTTVREWDIQHAAIQTAVAFLPDGHSAVIGDDAGNVRRWDYESDKPPVEFVDRHSGRINAVVASPNGRLIYTAGADGLVREWDVDLLRSTRIIGCLPEEILGISLSRSGNYVIGWTAHGTAVWSLHESPLVWTARPPGGGRPRGGLTFSADGQLGFCAYDQVWTLDPATGFMLETIVRDEAASSIMELWPNRDGSKLVGAAYAHNGESQWHITELIRWDIQTGRVERSASLSNPPVFAWSANGDAIALESSSGDLKQWDARNLTDFVTTSTAPHNRTDDLWTAGNHRGLHLPISAAPNGTYVSLRSDLPALLSWTPQRQIEVRSALDPRFSATIQNQSEFKFSAACLAPDGSVVFLGCTDGMLRVFDVRTGEILRELAAHNGMVTSVAMSPNGRQLITGSDDGTLRFWNIGLFEEIRQLQETLQAARENLSRGNSNGDSLRTIGEWYYVNEEWGWAMEFLQKARSAGAEVSELTLARCAWHLKELNAAEQSYESALSSGKNEATANYLKLCITAVKADQLLTPEWKAKVKEAAAPFFLHHPDDAADRISALIRVQPSDMSLYAMRGRAYGEMGRFSDAKTDLEKVVDSSSSVDIILDYACLSAYGDDWDAFTKSQKLLMKHLEDNYLAGANRAALGCLVRSSGEPQVAVAAASVERILKRSPVKDSLIWTSLNHGIASYRLGANAAAIESLKKAEENSNAAGSIVAQFFEAMALLHSGKEAEGRKLFAEANSRVDKELPKAGDKLFIGHEYWLICQLIQREAKAEFK
jgi:serine/threonine protein kinase/WD40 repeat protein